MMTFEQATELQEHADELKAIADGIGDIQYRLNCNAKTEQELNEIDQFEVVINSINNAIEKINELLKKGI